MKKTRPVMILKVKHAPDCPNGDAERVCNCNRVELVDLTPKLLADLKRQARAGAKVYLCTSQAAQLMTDFDGTLSARAREAIYGGNE